MRLGLNPRLRPPRVLRGITMDAFEFEEWRPVVGYEGWYEVSSFGRVKRIAPGYRGVRPKVLAQHTEKRIGYRTVSLCVNAKPVKIRVHVLVARAFLPNPDSKRTVNHKNGIRTDNRVENLEWATDSENQQHAYDVLGKKTKLTREIVAAVRRDYVTDPMMVVAKRYNMSLAHVYAVVHRKIWKHVP